MNDLRCRADNMQCWEGSGIIQKFSYPTTWPLTDVINDKFFLTYQGLKAGATIEIVRYDRKDFRNDDAEILEDAVVRVIKVKPREFVTLALIGKIVYHTQTQNETISNMHVRRGQSGKFRVMNGDEMVEEFGSKNEAEEALRQMIAA